jgi:histidyl-tRNA synthetase
MKRADASGAAMALVLGENEMNEQQVSVKYLREDRPQVTMQRDDLVAFLKNVHSA